MRSHERWTYFERQGNIKFKLRNKTKIKRFETAAKLK